MRGGFKANGNNAVVKRRAAKCLELLEIKYIAKRYKYFQLGNLNFINVSVLVGGLLVPICASSLGHTM
jgi:hypothetical protein